MRFKIGFKRKFIRRVDYAMQYYPLENNSIFTRKLTLMNQNKNYLKKKSYTKYKKVSKTDRLTTFV